MTERYFVYHGVFDTELSVVIPVSAKKLVGEIYEFVPSEELGYVRYAYASDVFESPQAAFEEAHARNRQRAEEAKKRLDEIELAQQGLIEWVAALSPKENGGG